MVKQNLNGTRKEKSAQLQRESSGARNTNKTTELRKKPKGHETSAPGVHWLMKGGKENHTPEKDEEKEHDQQRRATTQRHEEKLRPLLGRLPHNSRQNEGRKAEDLQPKI